VRLPYNNSITLEEQVYEIVSVTRSSALLMEIRPRRATAVPKTLEVSLRGLMDPYSGFFYIGPRSDLDWIVAGVVMVEKNRLAHARIRFARVLRLTGRHATVSFTPSSYSERAAQHLVAANLPAPPIPRALSLQSISKQYMRPDSIANAEREWAQLFTISYPDVVQPGVTEPEPSEELGPETDEPEGLSVWERLRSSV
jgi:hypothetical protein